jgi:hypothetical protein
MLESADILTLECLQKLGGKQPSQAMLHDLMTLAECEGNVHFDFATFCRIYVEYMCASAGNALQRVGCLTFCAATLSGRSMRASKANKRTGAYGNMKKKT